MKKQQKTLVLWIVVILMTVFAMKALEQKSEVSKSISYSEFISLVESGHVSEVTFQGQDTILGKFKSTYEKGTRFKLTGATGEQTFNILRKHAISSRIA